MFYILIRHVFIWNINHFHRNLFKTLMSSLKFVPPFVRVMVSMWNSTPTNLTHCWCLTETSYTNMSGVISEVQN